MGPFARTIGGVAGATLAGTTMMGAAPAANARSAAGPGRVITVPCNTRQLVSAVAQANAAGTATIRLAQRCTYLTNASLGFTGRDIRLLGGPSTVIKADPAQPPFGFIVGVSRGATLRAQGIFIIGGSNAAGAGGGIANAGNLTLDFVTVTGNAANDAGGLFNTGRALIVRSVIKANTSTLFGGGIVNAATLTLIESIVAGNHAGTSSGGIESGGVTNIRQSTIEKNTAAQGGGMSVFTGTTATLDRTLVQANKADPGLANGGGILKRPGSNVILRRSVVRFNAPTNCSPVGSVPGCLG